MPGGGLLTGMLVAGGVSALGSIGKGVVDYFAADKEQEAQQKALAQQEKANKEAQARADRNAAMSSLAVTGAGQEAGNYLQDYGAQAIGELQQGRDMALGQTLGYGQEAAGSLAAGYGSAIDTLYGAGGQGRQDLMGALGAYQDLGANSRVNQLLDDPSGYLAQDPGYQFRLQQGEQAINRANSAQGGRYSGRAMKEISQFGQGLASQEFGAAMGRATAADQAAMQRAGGIAGAYGQLAGQGMQAGSNVAGMQAGAGQAIANQQTGMGDRLSGLFTGTGSQLANAYQGIGTGFANNLNATAANYGNVLSGNTATSTGLTQSMIPAYSAAGQGAGNGLRSIGNTVSDLANVASNLTAGYAGYNAGGGGGSSGLPGVTDSDYMRVANMGLDPNQYYAGV